MSIITFLQILEGRSSGKEYFGNYNMSMQGLVHQAMHARSLLYSCVKQKLFLEDSSDIGIVKQNWSNQSYY